MTNEWCGWRDATERALYGPGGFYTRPDGPGPAGHFRTSVHASRQYAGAVATLLERVDEALGRPERLDVLDVGAGRGELLSGVLAALDAAGASAAGEATGEAAGASAGSLPGRLRAYAVEKAPRPEGLDPRITWLAELPPPWTLTGLLFANEWLDNVPVDVVETDPEGVVRRVLVRAEDGAERLGEPVTGEDAAWLAEWWPTGGDGGPMEGDGGPGCRAEIGRPRDAAWARAVRTLRRGFAVTADYAHLREARPPYGTLTGFRDGREAAPVPDGSRDITAHVALDACAAAGGTGALLLTQRAALRSLGVDGSRPPLALATTDPAAYLRALSGAGEAAELTDPGGLGAFHWLVQPVGLPAGAVRLSP
ncbi:SAM-dependent methyltransferase [Streptomyces violens]|uniref:SAM-dependent methyltransferase n=1 Tax=Streptomyces violens TaxID=66377 RepID=UPI0004C1E629|nr:SAM-dependent methyltransferase [Streptomyces violens]